MEKYREPFSYLPYFEEVTGKDSKAIMIQLFEENVSSLVPLPAMPKMVFFEQALRRLGELCGFIDND
ncbi:hypothetical protein PGH26_00660 [Sporosarcina jeotgali]|uniref:Uncharacterized protein n=1 Tax=Sporosarcina jeotgali TaxID=3020056 RepID=A0ABZ0KWA4_9BACL|nr:hypothetical protein [Sporosarcina sp. B2O-1]WOV84466.1 hypothetical protein PGH26_00660 [Sporosarcina sp. B2O-1]